MDVRVVLLEGLGSWQPNRFPPTANEDSSEFLCDRTYQSRVQLVFRNVRDMVNAFLYAEG